MNIHSQKARFAIEQYKSSSLPQGKTENINVSDENLADHYQSLRDMVIQDDNGPLDSDGTDGAITYVGGDYQDYKFKLAGDRLEKRIERAGYAQVDDITFGDDGIEVVSAHHDCVGSGGAKGGLSVDKIASDGSSLERQTWWMDVNPMWSDLFVPNFKSE